MGELWSREKILAGYEHHLFRDGRELARPGDGDLAISAAGIKVTDLVTSEDGSHVVRFDLSAATGWYRPGGTGPAVPLTGAPDDGLNVGFRAEGESGWASSVLLAFATWIRRGWAVEMYAAPGKWTFIWCEQSDFQPRYVTFLTVIPPGPDGAMTGPEPPVLPAIDPALTLMIPVTILLPPADGGSADAYQRTWMVPARYSEDIAAMLTHRFGEPVELLIDPGKVAERADEFSVRLPGTGPEWFRQLEEDQ